MYAHCINKKGEARLGRIGEVVLLDMLRQHQHTSHTTQHAVLHAAGHGLQLTNTWACSLTAVTLQNWKHYEEKQRIQKLLLSLKRNNWTTDEIAAQWFVILPFPPCIYNTTNYRIILGRVDHVTDQLRKSWPCYRIRFPSDYKKVLVYACPRHSKIARFTKTDFMHFWHSIIFLELYCAIVPGTRSHA